MTQLRFLAVGRLLLGVGLDIGRRDAAGMRKDGSTLAARLRHGSCHEAIEDMRHKVIGESRQPSIEM